MVTMSIKILLAFANISHDKLLVIPDEAVTAKPLSVLNCVMMHSITSYLTSDLLRGRMCCFLSQLLHSRTLK